MKTSYAAAILVSAFLVIVGAVPRALAFETYSSPSDPSTGNCANCHGEYKGGNYTSNSDGTPWNDNLMGGHQSFIGDSGSNECDVCHSGTNKSPVYLNLSDLTAKPYGCVGCHGRDEDVTANDGVFGGSVPGRGDGLRAHHMASEAYLNWPPPGGLTCATCHNSDTTPVDEDVLPFNYSIAGTISDPCSGENHFGATGLDNDGDRAYDAADWDCSLPGDSDRDGSSDILWRNMANGQNSLWLMAAGRRSGQQLVPAVTDTNWKIIGRGDHDGDGNADILWRKSNPGQPDDGQMAIWLMQGGERLANLGLPTVSGTDWRVVGRGDYDGDGNADILWRNIANGQNAMWRIVDGVLDANLAVSSVSNLDWTVVGDGDFDGDGNDDILWRNTATGGMALWRMDGASRLDNEAVPSVTEAGWVVMADGDYNGDGTADIFWRNTLTGLNAMWLMDGAIMTANLPVLSFSSTDWQVAGADGDFNGDGMSDLYWRNTATGANSMWLMNSEERVGHFNIPAVPTGAWEVAPAD